MCENCVYVYRDSCEGCPAYVAPKVEPTAEWYANEYNNIPKFSKKGERVA